MKRVFYAAVMAIALASTARAGYAQGAAQPREGVSLGLALGASMPIGDFGDVANTGFHAAAMLDAAPSTSPIGFRIEGMYHRFGGDHRRFFAMPDWRVFAGTANITLALPGQSRATPYFIGGLGAYNLSCTDSDCDGTTRLGVNGGLGFRFVTSGGHHFFVEGRVHSIDTDGDSRVNLMPFTFGINF